MRDKPAETDSSKPTNVISIADRIARRASSQGAPVNPTFADALQAVVRARSIENDAMPREPAVVLDFSERRRDGSRGA